MTDKQNIIREEIIEIFMNAKKDVTLGNAIGSYRYADQVLSYLHSQGVVIKGNIYEAYPDLWSVEPLIEESR